jgi:hypothetical protein
MSEEIVIIGGSNVLTASGGDGTENHLRYGAENDRVTLIQRTWRDIHDIFDDAERLGRQYAIRQFILAPYEDMSRDFMLTVALPILAKEFKFRPFECSIVEHEKGRADPGACRVHWHIVLAHFDPDTGKVGKRWWQDRQRHERVARIIEYKQWAAKPETERDPAGPNFVRGRFHEANIDSLRADQNPEMQAIGAALELRLPRGIEPQGTAPADNVVRMHKRAGVDIVQLRKLCREAWKKSTTAEEFRQLLEAEGLRVTLAEEPPPRWMIANDATVLGTLAGMVHAKRNDVIARMGDPKYDQWYTGEESRGRSGTNDIDAGEHREAAALVESVVDRVPVVAVQPERQGHGSTSAELFVAALRRADPPRLKKLTDRATQLAQSAFARAISYLAAAEKGAREYLTWTAQDLPVPSKQLSELREKRKLLAKKMADATAALEHQSGADRDHNLEVRGRARVDIEDMDQIAAPLEALYESEAEKYRATIVKEKAERANRYLRIVPRIRALIDHAPQVLWAGVETIFARAVLEDKKAKPGARFRAEPSSSSTAKDDTGLRPPGPKL